MFTYTVYVLMTYSHYGQLSGTQLHDTSGIPRRVLCGPFSAFYGLILLGHIP